MEHELPKETKAHVKAKTGGNAPMKRSLQISTFLLSTISCIVQAASVRSVGLSAEPGWKTLGGNFQRTGLAEYAGPRLGCIKWKFQTEGAIVSTTTVGFGGRVHVACENGTLYTLDPNGSLLWTYDAGSPLLSSPTIGPDGAVYTGSRDGKLHAVSATGELRWTYQTAGSIYSSPALSADGNSVYFGSIDGRLYALGQNGNELWSFQTKGVTTLDGAIFASPAIGSDGTVFVCGIYDPNLYALAAETGNPKWKYTFDSGGWLFSSPVIAKDGPVYQTLLYDPNLYAIDPNKGTIIWSTNLADPCSGLFESGYERGYGDAYCCSELALGPDGTIYVSLDDPYLRAVEPNGHLKWAARLGMVGCFTLSVGKDGLIYAADDDGYINIVDPNALNIAQCEIGGWPGFPVIPTESILLVTDSQDYSFLITTAKNIVWTITKDCPKNITADLHWPQDLDGNGYINFHDIALLAKSWLSCTDRDSPCGYSGDQLYLANDVNRDFYVGWEDIAAIAEQWLIEDGSPWPGGQHPG
jgi:outer membrane protein assembly factor BamB